MGDTEAVKQRIVLTGATGFIGAQLQQQLLSRGHHVLALVRADSPHSDRIIPGVEQCIVALSDTDNVSDALENADLVIYCAGSVRGRDLDDFDAANVSGLDSVCAAAVKAMRTPRLILISSLAATRPHLSPYASSKHAGEKLLATHLKLEWTVVRPPAVYGPGDDEMRPLLQAIRRGLAPMIGPDGQRLSLLFVNDLATAVASIAEQFEACRGRYFEPDDGHPAGYSWPQIITETKSRLPVLRLPVPRSVLEILARINLRLANWLNYRPMLTPGKVRELSESSWLCDNQPLTAATGWQPKFSLRQGVCATFTPDPAREIPSRN